MKLKFILILSLFISSVSNLLADPDCDYCIQGAANICSSICKKYAKTITPEVCTERCVKKRCAPNCKLSNDTKEEKRPVTDMSCEYCLRVMKSGKCQKKCVKEGELRGNCISDCAKRECGNKCSLPDRKVNDSGFRAIEVTKKQKCKMCRFQAKNKCAANCRRGPEEPGLETCLMACEENTCAQVCYPEVE